MQEIIANQYKSCTSLAVVAMRSFVYVENKTLFFKGLAMIARVEDLRRNKQDFAANAFTDAMSRAVSGVSIVTTNGPNGRYGLTISSMTSVSADPPMLLLCVNRSSIAHDAIRDNEHFAVNVLASHQVDIASQFAGRSTPDERYRFDRQSWDTGAALPSLRGAAAVFECRLVSAMTFGSHSIIIGEVTASSAGEDTPLLYTRRNYGRPVCLN
jgi:flavin reductase (DIM6/NTAB) family NADH-FMN oxidoreductase RutF